MKLTTRLAIAAVLLTNSTVIAQIERFDYYRPLNGITDQWHTIEVPSSVLSKASSQLNDLRVFGITSTDTLEAAYLLDIGEEKRSSQPIAFTLLNQTRKDNLYYFTMEVPEVDKINRIDLDFAQQNFDWRVTLEGSQNQNEWFTITENERILSIKNNLTDYTFSRLSFPDTQYKYYRLIIKSDVRPILNKAKILNTEVTTGRWKDIKVKDYEVTEHKKSKRTIIDVNLSERDALSQLTLSVNEEFDYYRRFSIQYAADSFNTEKGWNYSYRELASGMLSSLEKAQYTFNSTLAHKIRVIIENRDNEPLSISNVKVRGYQHQMVVRFTKPAEYILAYGSKFVARPQYDIAYFKKNIPKELKPIQSGEELLIPELIKPAQKPLFENKAWLWVILISIIGVLGWFTFKMMRTS